MAERRSALAHLPGSAPSTAGVIVREVWPSTIVQIAAWPDTLAEVRQVISDLLHLELPRLGTSAGDEHLIILAVAPGRYLLAGGGADLVARLAGAIPSELGAVTDLSHGRAILRIEGQQAVRVLAKGVAIDLDPGVFPAGRVAQTAIHHIDVAVHRCGEDIFDLWVLRGFAEALAEWLLDAGVELGAGFAA